jgi:16S rRNA (guanine527-N7)-methyltransferase
MDNRHQYLKEQLKLLSICSTKEQIEQLIQYYDYMIKINQSLNLTRIVEFEEVTVKHFLDSAALCNFISLEQPQKLLDLGTGAGFPGIPLKILFPQLKITLVDSLKKRIHFLDDVISLLQLDGICAVHARAEELAQLPDFREQFDLCTSRAVANLSTLSEYCVPFVKVGGQFISYKSGEVEEELNQAKGAIKKLGGTISRVEHFSLPESELQRTFVFIEKIKRTEKKFPRKAGTPSKVPLT